MQVNIRELGSLFCSREQWVEISYEESFDSISIELSLGELHVDAGELSDEPDFKLSARDEISISVIGATENVPDYYPAHNNTWDSFISGLQEVEDEENLTLAVNINKRRVDGMISVYDEEELVKYINKKDLLSVFEIFDDLIIDDRPVIFEIQNNHYSSFKTRKFVFVPKGENVDYDGEDIHFGNIIENSKVICTNNLITAKLTPDSFQIEGGGDENQPIQKLFNHIGQLFLMCFIASFAKIEENSFDFKISGYKTIHQKINFNDLLTANIETKSLALYYQIYHWLYKGGNIYDKASIVRNIVTLNIDDQSLLIKDTTFDSVISNYNVFEKKNVEQYIGLRNEVAKQLSVYQKEMYDIVNGFENDFKTLFFGYMAFVFTTVIVRVIAKNVGEDVLIPNTIIALLMLYCGASLAYQCYARSILDGRIKLFDRQYNKTRSFYSELLSENELNELFTDKRNKDGSYQAFLKEREAHFDMLWLCVNILTMIVLVIIWCFNEGWL
mgnify:CR=1 FL=1